MALKNKFRGVAGLVLEVNRERRQPNDLDDVVVPVPTIGSSPGLLDGSSSTNGRTAVDHEARPPSRPLSASQSLAKRLGARTANGDSIPLEEAAEAAGVGRIRSIADAVTRVKEASAVAVAEAAALAAGDAKLPRVDKAVFRSVTDTSLWKMREVTDAVNRLIEQNGPEDITGMKSLRKVLGDPAPGDRKHLVITIGKYTVQFKEHTDGGPANCVYNLTTMFRKAKALTAKDQMRKWLDLEAQQQKQDAEAEEQRGKELAYMEREDQLSREQEQHWQQILQTKHAERLACSMLPQTWDEEFLDYVKYGEFDQVWSYFHGSKVDMGKNLDLQGPYVPMSATWGHVQVMGLLLTMRADVDSAMYGKPALTLAVENGHVTVVETLVEKRCAVNATDLDGMSPLARALAFGPRCHQMIELLRKAGAEAISLRGLLQNHDILSATRYIQDAHDRREGVRRTSLVEEYVGEINKAELTLMYLAHLGDSKGVRSVIDNEPVDACATDPAGRTAADMARLQGHRELADFLELVLQRVDYRKKGRSRRQLRGEVIIAQLERRKGRRSSSIATGMASARLAAALEYGSGAESVPSTPL